MAKNENVVNDFIKGISTTKTKHLFIEQEKNGVLILYSYGYHFPLSIKLNDNTFLINSNGYSNTTARHKSLLCRGLTNLTFKDLEKDIKNQNNIMLFNTEQLKDIISNEFKTKLEVIQSKI